MNEHTSILEKEVRTDHIDGIDVQPAFGTFCSNPIPVKVQENSFDHAGGFGVP